VSDGGAAGTPHAHAHGHELGHEHDHTHVHDDAIEPGRPAVDAGPVERRMGRIEVEHLHHVYPDGTEALRGIHLTVEPGERVALVGPNGAGKSTLLLHVNGILEATHGSVRVDGVTVGRSSVRQVRAKVGVVFQDPDDQLFSPTVREDVAFGPIHMGLPESSIHDRVERALAAVGMSGSERRLPHHLSIGERKRISVATVLSMDPTVLVFDEPTAGLDPRGRREFITVMADRHETLLVASHDMALVADVCARLIVIDAGEVVADGPASDILGDGALLAAHGLEKPCR
jgi:cobalt transport protein ATP-binding subunit